MRFRTTERDVNGRMLRDSCVCAAIALAGLGVLAALLSGCNYVVAAGYLIGGPPSIEPDFDRQTNLSMTSYNTTVAIVCYAPTELKLDHARIDKELTKYVANKLTMKKIQVINPDRVHAWMDAHPDWDRAEEIGAAFNASYVVYIDLATFSLYEKNSANLYRGRSEAFVSVFKMHEDGEGEKIYSKDINSQYPLSIPRSTSEVSYPTFKRQYLLRLSEEIGRLFYEHYNGDDIPDAV